MAPHVTCISVTRAVPVLSRPHAHPAPPHERLPGHQRELGPGREGRHGDYAQQNRTRRSSIQTLLRGTGRHGELASSSVITPTLTLVTLQPAHVKACFLGSNLTVPVSDGKLNLGTWQGVWLCEHRDRAGSRKVRLVTRAENTLGPDQSLIADSVTSLMILWPGAC